MANALCVEVEVATSAVNCNGSEDGEISVSITQSSGKYILRLLHSDNNRLVDQKSLWQDTSLVFSDLKASKYLIQIVSEIGQLTRDCFVEEPKPLTANTIEIIKKPTDDATCDGIIEARPTGGTHPYSIEWSENSGKQSTATATNLCRGIYRCLISDANNCAKVSATVYLPDNSQSGSTK